MKDVGLNDVLKSKIDFYPELPRVDKDEMTGFNFVLMDATIIDDWDGQFGVSQFALLKAELDGGKQVTTLCGGKAVVRQIGKLLRMHKLPGRIITGITMAAGKGNNYYLLTQFENPPAEKEKEAASVKA